MILISVLIFKSASSFKFHLAFAILSHQINYSLFIDFQIKQLFLKATQLLTREKDKCVKIACTRKLYAITSNRAEHTRDHFKVKCRKCSSDILN